MANGSMMKRVRQITGLVGTGLIATMLPLVAYAETEIGAKLDPALVASKIYERYTDQQTRSSQQDLWTETMNPETVRWKSPKSTFENRNANVVQGSFTFLNEIVQDD